MNINLKTDITWRDFLIRAGLIICTVTIIVWAMPRDTRTHFKIEKGRPWVYADLKAPFDFPIYKSEEAVKAERDSLLKEYEPYFNHYKETEDKQIRQFVKDYNQGIPGLPADYISLIANRLRSLYKQGIMSTSDFSMVNSDTTRTIRMVSGKTATSMTVTNVLSTVTAYEQLFSDPDLSAFQDVLQKCNLNDYIMPNLVYDKERSEASLADLTNSIPLASGIALRGQKIVERGDIVDSKTYNVLLSFEKEMDRREKNEQQISVTIMGQILYIAILITAFTVYLSLFRKDYFERMRSMAMLYALIIIFTVLASVMVTHNVLHIYIVPFAMVPIFIRVFMDSRTAFMAHIIMLLMCASILQHPLEFMAVEVVAGLVAIFSLRELSSRSQLFWTAVLVAAAAALTNVALDWVRSAPLLLLPPAIPHREGIRIYVEHHAHRALRHEQGAAATHERGGPGHLPALHTGGQPGGGDSQQDWGQEPAGAHRRTLPRHRQDTQPHLLHREPVGRQPPCQHVVHRQRTDHHLARHRRPQAGRQVQPARHHQGVHCHAPRTGQGQVLLHPAEEHPPRRARR